MANTGVEARSQRERSMVNMPRQFGITILILVFSQAGF
jgi:hypothetical protein